MSLVRYPISSFNLRIESLVIESNWIRVVVDDEAGGFNLRIESLVIESPLPQTQPQHTRLPKFQSQN